jgi:hypothetical protein
MGPKLSLKCEPVGEDNVDVNGLSSDMVLSKDDICICNCDISKGGSFASGLDVGTFSSRNFAITDPDPFLGPLFFRAMSLVHLSPAATQRSQGSAFEHRTFLRRQASQGRSLSNVAGPLVWSSDGSAMHETLPQRVWAISAAREVI